jgi:predicted AAA+ superfamily ATPase
LRLDLLEPDVQREYAARPKRLRERLAAEPEVEQVVIDEVQRVPEFLAVVHSLIESRRTLQFILTGSSARKLSLCQAPHPGATSGMTCRSNRR